MGPHSCKNCLRGHMMANCSKDELRVPAAKCEENGFGADSIPCTCSFYSYCKVHSSYNIWQY